MRLAIGLVFSALAMLGMDGHAADSRADQPSSYAAGSGKASVPRFVAGDFVASYHELARMEGLQPGGEEPDDEVPALPPTELERACGLDPKVEIGKEQARYGVKARVCAKKTEGRLKRLRICLKASCSSKPEGIQQGTVTIEYPWH